MGDVVRALISVHYSQFGYMHEGDLFEADHPLVKEHPDWFSDDLLAIATRTPRDPKRKARTTATQELEVSP
jgi:hypothetical protein